jgi:hypothetical protein
VYVLRSPIGVAGRKREKQVGHPPGIEAWLEAGSFEGLQRATPGREEDGAQLQLWDLICKDEPDRANRGAAVLLEIRTGGKIDLNFRPSFCQTPDQPGHLILTEYRL